MGYVRELNITVQRNRGWAQILQATQVLCSHWGKRDHTGSRPVGHTAGRVNEISESVSCQVQGGVQRKLGTLYQALQRRNTNSIFAVFEAVGKRIRQAKGLGTDLHQDRCSIRSTELPWQYTLCVAGLQGGAQATMHISTSIF